MCWQWGDASQRFSFLLRFGAVCTTNWQDFQCDQSFALFLHNLVLHSMTHRDFSADESTYSNKKAIIVPLVTSSWVRNLWLLSDHENDNENPVWQKNKKYLAPTRWFLKNYLLKACRGDHNKASRSELWSNILKLASPSRLICLKIMAGSHGSQPNMKLRKNEVWIYL